MRALLAVLALASCSAGVKDGEPVWRGVQRVDEGLAAPAPLFIGLALFICAETWAQERPQERTAAFDALSGIEVWFVPEAELLLDHPEFEHVFEDSPLPGVMRVAVDAPGDPLRAIGHGCAHLILEEAFGVGFTDDTHSTEGVWNDGEIVALVQNRISALLSPDTREATP